MTSDESWDEGCVAPPEQSGIAGLAATDSDMDESSCANLQECPHCAAQAAQMNLLQTRLRRRLYRLFCPATDLLVDYCQGLLDPYQCTSITHHLAICPHCAAEIVMLEASAPSTNHSTPPNGLFAALRGLS